MQNNPRFLANTKIDDLWEISSNQVSKCLYIATILEYTDQNTMKQTN